MKSKVSLIPNTKVTGDAQAVIAGLLAWITNPTSSQHCTVTGGPGAGKTWMIKELVKAHKTFNRLGIGTRTDLHISGTTHDSLAIISKALDDTSLKTIYAELDLVPHKGIIHLRQGGEKRPAAYNPEPGETYLDDTLYICDESNYITQETLTIISKWWPSVRIIFIGSEHQLGTESGPSKIFQQGWDNYFLNTSYRADNADVQQIYDMSEEDVISKVRNVRHIQNPSVMYLHDADWMDLLKRAYTSDKAAGCITLAHTNKRVFELVGHIRNIQGKTGYFTIGEPVQALRLGTSLLSKKKIRLVTDNNGLVYIPVPTGPKGKQIKYSYVGDSWEHYEYLCSSTHTRITNEIYPSLVASTEASTVHGAQGGTWDYTFLDLTNFESMKRYDMETYRRAMHVGKSRHRKKLFIKIT